jgi:putative acetyltransferase
MSGGVEGSWGAIPVTPSDPRSPKTADGYILAPLAVSPGHQKRGIASQLIENGIERLSELGSGVILVYGDPEFYSRFGFFPDHAGRFTAPYHLQYPFGWQGLALGDSDAPSSSLAISCVASLANPALW